MVMCDDLRGSFAEPNLTEIVSKSVSVKYPPHIAYLRVPVVEDDHIEKHLRLNWKSYPSNVRELLFIEDILNILCGVEGSLLSLDLDNRNAINIRVNPLIDKKFDGTLCILASEILELAVMQRDVQNFIYSNDRGYIFQSFCEVLNVLLQELQSRIGQFDATYRNNGLGLQKFKLYLQPALCTFELLNKIILNTNDGNITGVDLINRLISVERMFGPGDVRRSLSSHLIKQVMDSYCYLIQQWIHFGVLYDNFQDFFVVERFDADYAKNEAEFVIEWSKVPELLKGIAELILDTGVYVRILNLNGSHTFDDDLGNKNKLCYISIDDLTVSIRGVHDLVSSKLMDFIISGCDFVGKLESFRRFFLLERADYLTNLLQEMTDEESLDLLNIIFEGSVNNSSLCNDSYKGDYTLDFHDNTNLQDAVNGLNSVGPHKVNPLNNIDTYKKMVLCCKVKWPLNLIFTQESMSRYQLIFRLLLHFKHAEQRLSKVWLNYMKSKELPLDSKAQLRLHSAFLTMERMLFFCRSFVRYATEDVIERKYKSMIQSFGNFTHQTRDEGRSISRIKKQHQAFLLHVTKECFLHDPGVFSVMNRILSVCQIFAKQMSKFVLNGFYGDEHYEFGVRYSETSVKEAPCIQYLIRRQESIEERARFAANFLKNPGYSAMVRNTSKHLSRNISLFVKLLEGLADTPDRQHAQNLLTNLNFNGFF